MESNPGADAPTGGKPSNRLLDSLSREARRRILGDADSVQLRAGEVMHEPGALIRHVYFPVQGFISIVVSVGESSQLEVGLVGDEGMLGLPLLLGVDTSPLRALVQGPGSAWRIGAEAFSRELERIPAFRIELLRYLQACYLKLAQAAACTRFHVVEERLARWLLMTQDRAHGEAFHMTHQFLAELLGVRRVGITKAASAMQERGLIEYHRGQIHILDRAGLKRASCSCYQSERDIYDGLLLPARPRVRSRAARPA